MKREIWEFLAGGRHHVIRGWLDDEKISARERAKLDVKLNLLRTLDFGLVSKKLMAGPLAGTKVYKLRVRCENRELRPMLCRGPIGSEFDYTLLQGAREIGSHLEPRDAQERADRNREELLLNHKWREQYK